MDVNNSDLHPPSPSLSKFDVYIIGVLIFNHNSAAMQGIEGKACHPSGYYRDPSPTSLKEVAVDQCEVAQKNFKF
jgi:hypothetical protein